MQRLDNVSNYPANFSTKRISSLSQGPSRVMNPSIQMLGYHLSFFHCLSLASGRTYSEDTCNYIFTDYAMKFVLLCISKLASKLNFSSTAIMPYSCSEIMDWDSGITSSSPGYWDLYCGTREYLPPLYIVEEKYR